MFKKSSLNFGVDTLIVVLTLTSTLGIVEPYAEIFGGVLTLAEYANDWFS